LGREGWHARERGERGRERESWDVRGKGGVGTTGGKSSMHERDSKVERKLGGGAFVWISTR